MNQRHAPPPASHGRRQNQGSGKSARPGLHRRVHSYQNAAAQASGAASKTTTAAAKRAAREEGKLVEEDDGMAGLPQFCTTCERQIINPANSTLYCSRACQRRDSHKPSPIEPLVSPTFISAPSYFDAPQPDIIPQRSPTVLRPLSSTFSDWHVSSEGLDSPTSSSSDYDNDATIAERRRRSKRLSDETKFYAHFPDLTEDFTSTHNFSNLTRYQRPHPNRASTSTLPSLSHTPSSSVGTVASFNSTSNLHYHSNANININSSSAYRPFHAPPHHRQRSNKSVDLVIPTFGPVSGAGETCVDGDGSRSASVKSEASTLTSFCAVEAERSAEQSSDRKKRQGQEGRSPASGSLRQLFAHEGMRGTGSGAGKGERSRALK